METKEKPPKEQIPIRPLSKHSLAISKKYSINDFKDCVFTYSKSLENSASNCGELQELFLSFANSNKILPDNFDSENIDSFIAILITLVSVNYENPIAIQSLTVLFNYLRNDEKVFERFNPSKELIKRLNFDKYLNTKNDNGKRLVLNFIYFLTRHYDIEYTDILADPDTLPMIRRAEVEQIHIEIENLGSHQENILKVAEENQQITSNAFAELFSYIEDIRKRTEHTEITFRKELDSIKGEIVRLSNIKASQIMADQTATLEMIKGLEKHFQGKIAQTKEYVEALASKMHTMENDQNNLNKKFNDISVYEEGVKKDNQEINKMISKEAQIAKAARDMMLARINKLENDVLSCFGKEKQDYTSDIMNLRIDSLRNQMEIELVPKVNELMNKYSHQQVFSSLVKELYEDQKWSLIAKIDNKAIEGISELIRTGIDTAANEAKSCKKLIESLTEQFDKFKQTKDSSQAEIKKEIEDSYNQLQTKFSTHIDSAEIQITNLKDKLKSFVTDIEDTKRHMDEIPKYDLKVFTDAIASNSERINEMENEYNKLTTGFKQIERTIEPFSMQLENTQESINKLQVHIHDLGNQVNFIQSQTHILSQSVPSNKVEPMVQEMKEVKYNDSIWEYVQRFIDLHATDKCYEIKSKLNDYTHKLNCLQWLLRYHKLLSDEASSLVIEAFKGLIPTDNMNEVGAYMIIKHDSDVIIDVVNLITMLVKGNTLEEAKQVLPDIRVYMGVLEICLINDQNLEIAISLGIIKILIQHIILFKSLYDLSESIGEFQLTVRCLTHCFRNAWSIDLLMENEMGLNLVFDIMQGMKDEELIANATKIITVSLRSDKSYNKILQTLPLLFNSLIQLITTQAYSIAILNEATMALKYYTRKASSLQLISEPRMLEPICEFAVSNDSSVYRNNSILVLRNCCKDLKLLNYIKQTAAHKVVIDAEEC